MDERLSEYRNQRKREIKRERMATGTATQTEMRSLLPVPIV